MFLAIILSLILVLLLIFVVFSFFKNSKILILGSISLTFIYILLSYLFMTSIHNTF